MENRPERTKDKDYYLKLLKKTILDITDNGLNNDTVFLHTDYEYNTAGNLIPSKLYFNPSYDPETKKFEISRLIPSPDKGEFASMLNYVFYDNSPVIHRKQKGWNGPLGGYSNYPDKIYSTTDEIEYLFRCVGDDAWQLPQDEAEKMIRRHRIRMSKDYQV